MSNTEPVIPEDLRGLWAQAQLDSTKPWHWMQIVPGRIIALIERIARLTSDLAAARENASQNADSYLACEKRFEEAIAQRDAANLRVEGLEHEWNDAEERFNMMAEQRLAVQHENAALKARVEQLSGPVTEEAYLLEVIVAAKDVLTSFQYELSYLPAQRAYKTTMSENERLCAKTIADLETIIRARSERSSQ